MADNTLLNAGTGGDTVRDLARQSGTVKTQVVQIDIGGPTTNAEVLVTAGQQAMAASLPVVIASNQTAIPTAPTSLPSIPAGTAVIGGVVPIDSAGTIRGTIKAASTAAVATDTSLVVQLNGGFPLPAGTNSIGTVQQAALTKGAQGATGVSTQDLKDSGRNQTNYFTATLVALTAAEALLSLTGYKSGAAVAATTTPAVVTTGKTYRVQSITITYAATTTTEGSVQVNLRANSTGVGAVTSALVCSWNVGLLGGAEIVGSLNTVSIPIPDGMEFPAGTGLVLTGLGLIGLTATAVGDVKVSMTGYEY